MAASKKVTTVKAEDTAVKKDAVKEEVKEVKAAPVKKEEPKAEPAKKEEVKAEPAKKEEAKAEKKEVAKKETVKKAPAKKATKKAEIKSEVTVQFGGKSYSEADLVKIAKDVWKYDLKQKVSEFETVELYVKPEESCAYYVINGKFTGSFEI